MPDRVIIQDDKTYHIEEFQVTAPGSLLKDPAFFQLLRFGHLIKANIFRTLPCQTRYDNNRAYQYSASPPRYIVFPEFPGIQDLAMQLRIPKRIFNVYYSLFLGGGEYVRPSGQAFHDYQEYTVELFGRRIDQSSRRGARPSRFFCAVPPNFWRESRNELIEVWRTRIFHCTSDKLGISPSRPVTLDKVSRPFLQAVWDGKLKRNVISFEGLGNLHHGESQEEFCSNTERVLLRRRPKGRSRGSGVYPITSDFQYNVERAISKLWSENQMMPDQEDVAWELNLGVSNFKKKWRKTLLRWDNFVATVIQRLTPQG